MFVLSKLFRVFCNDLSYRLFTNFHLIFLFFLPLYSRDRQLRDMVLATLPRIPCAFGASDTRDDDCPKPNHTWKPGLRTNSSIFSEHDLKDANISGQIAKLIHSSKVGFLKGVWQGGSSKKMNFLLSLKVIYHLLDIQNVQATEMRYNKDTTRIRIQIVRQ